MGALTSTEKGDGSTLEKGPQRGLTVVQPPKLQELGALLETLDGLAMRVGEKTGDDRSSDLGAGAGAMVTAGTATTGISPRDHAIANLPVPEVMQHDLERYIRKEVRKLNREARTVARLGKPGAAHYLNELYAKMRRLNALLKEILEASVDVLKRLFIRVFVDKQPIL